MREKVGFFVQMTLQSFIVSHGASSLLPKRATAPRANGRARFEDNVDVIARIGIPDSSELGCDGRGL